jgi:hypothetical protein
MTMKNSYFKTEKKDNFCDFYSLIDYVRCNVKLCAKYKVDFSEELDTAPKIIQYWDNNVIPVEIENAYKLWDEFLHDSDLNMFRFNKHSAAAWLKENDEKAFKKFEHSFHPAMEADIFRLAFAKKEDIVWLDSDHVPQNFHNNYDSLKTFEVWSKLPFSSFLLKKQSKGTPFVNNSIFKSKASCPIIKALYKRMISMKIGEPSSDFIAKFAGPIAYTEVIDEFIRKQNAKFLIDGNRGEFKLISDEGEFIISNLFSLIGSKPDWGDVFDSNDWEYKNSKVMNWKLI